MFKKNELMKNEDYESQYCYFNLFTLGCIKVNGVLTTSIDELVTALRDAVKIRSGEKYEISRTFVAEYLDPERLKIAMKYNVQYSDGTIERIEEVVEDE